MGADEGNADQGNADQRNAENDDGSLDGIWWLLAAPLNVLCFFLNLSSSFRRPYDALGPSSRRWTWVESKLGVVVGYLVLAIAIVVIVVKTR